MKKSKPKKQLTPKQVVESLSLKVIERALLDYMGVDLAERKVNKESIKEDAILFFDSYENTIWSNYSGLHPEALWRLKRKAEAVR